MQDRTDAPAAGAPPVRPATRSWLKALAASSGAAGVAWLMLATSSGDGRWLQAGAFALVYGVLITALTLLVFQPHPELVAERRAAAKLAPRWDRRLVVLQGLMLPLMMVVAGLDRRHWWLTPVPAAAAVPAGAGMMLLGGALTVWSMRVNAFFSSHVRVQLDRGHHVVDQGPYRWLRHPGYGGSALINLGGALLLGSWPALTVASGFVALTALRITLEERVLREQLPGYRDYCASVRHRLLPWLW